MPFLGGFGYCANGMAVMRFSYTLEDMLEIVRSFITVLEEGSLNRAAAVLRLTQPSLTRQMQALEAEAGGLLLERKPTGVQPTALGHALAQKLKPVLEQSDAVWADLRRLARGQHADLKIGYLAAAAHAYLNPALAALRKQHPNTKVTLLDLSPAEQIAALRRGEIDLALIGQEGEPLSREFYLRRLVSLGVVAVLPSDHPLADRTEIRTAELARESFVGASPVEVPGRNQWITQLCRKAGFRTRFCGNAETVGAAFSWVVAEGAVLLLPNYLDTAPPGVALVPIADRFARWEFLLLRQRGRAAQQVKSMETLLLASALRRQTSPVS